METVAAAQPGSLLRDASRAAGPTFTLRSDVAAPRRNGGVARRRNEPQTDAAPRRTSVIVTAAGRPYGGSTTDENASPTRRWHSSAPESPQVADGLAHAHALGALLELFCRLVGSRNCLVPTLAASWNLMSKPSCLSQEPGAGCSW